MEDSRTLVTQCEIKWEYCSIHDRGSDSSTDVIKKLKNETESSRL